MEKSPPPRVPATQPAHATSDIPTPAQLQRATGIEWCEVPAGAFWMGNNESDAKPKHQVTLSAFLISRFPITNAQYDAFVQDKGYEQQEFWVPAGWAWRQHDEISSPGKSGSDFDLPDHPVVNVSWYEAAAFARWLSQRSGQPIHLPTEAEWEKAACGADGRVYPWGNEREAGRANTWESQIKATTAVGQFSPAGDSPYGAADMSGNVWEWCQSLYESYPYQPTDRREGLSIEGFRVLRGGSWRDSLVSARCAYRFFNSPDSRSINRSGFGFRIVCAPALPF